MTRSDKLYLQQTARLATSSQCRSQKHGALIVFHGKVIAAAVNVDKNHPSVFGDDEMSAKAWASIHAERAALKQLSTVPRNSVIYVARVNASGQPLFSRPCDQCFELLSLIGIRKAVYTVGDR